MLKTRIIPCLLVRGDGLVKTRQFEDPKYVGDPINAIRIFNDKEVDELMVLDISASPENRPPNYQLVEQYAGECFMPLCVGGGIKTFEHARRLFALGVEKVCLQSGAMADMSLVTRIAERYGAQAVVVSVDVKRSWLGKRLLYAAAARKTVSEPWQSFMRRAVEAGAGEILLTSVDRDGTLKGMDIDLIREASSAVTVPLVAAGGANSLEDMKAAAAAGASGVSAGAFFVFHGPHRAVLITYPRREELERVLGDSPHSISVPQ